MHLQASATIAGTMMLTCLLITACGKPPIQSGTAPPPAENPAGADQPVTLKKLDEELRILQLKLTTYTLDQSNQLLARVVPLEERTHAKAAFDPTDTSYQRIDAPKGFGSFAISVRDVRDFGDGIRIKLNIGNPSSAGFSNMKLKLTYGPRWHPSEAQQPSAGASLAETEKAMEASEKRLDEIDAWTKSLQTKDVTLTEYVRPAYWTPVLVTLPGIRAAQFGYLDVSIETNVINLAGPE
jgi:hypothetical protein